MPSVSPENRRTSKHRRSHSRSKERSRSPGPASDKSAAERSKKRRDEQERDSSGPSRDRRRKDNDRGQRAAAGSDHRRTVEDGSRERRPSSSRRSVRENNSDRNRREREDVRVKQEPVSEDEEERRRRRRGIERRRARDRDGDAQHRDGGRRPEGLVAVKEEEVEKPKEKVNFGLSGKLTEDTNVFNGVVIKYNEPTEARKPNKRWRLYPFKGEEQLPILPIHRQSAYLLGRERKIADIPIDHPSCSKQHAVVQFRAMQYEREDGRMGKRIRPYIIDLDSANGTYVNNGRIEPRRYVELMERDVVKFGFSSREYVLLHEGSVADDDEVAPEDDQPEEGTGTAEGP